QCQILTIATLQSENINTGIDISQLLLTGGVVGRKRQQPICDFCCGDSLCNDDQCDVVK
ncbi:hypothetical protein ACJMK2_038716, partial [Sinanodonta woodiana]